MRFDLLLCRLRFAKSRSIAQRRIAEGHMRLNGARVVQADRQVKPGDVLTLPLGKRVAVVEVIILPDRRGPPSEAQACYRELDAGASFAIAGAEPPDAAEELKGNSRP